MACESFLVNCLNENCLIAKIDCSYNELHLKMNLLKIILSITQKSEILLFTTSSQFYYLIDTVFKNSISLRKYLIGFKEFNIRQSGNNIVTYDEVFPIIEKHLDYEQEHNTKIIIDGEFEYFNSDELYKNLRDNLLKILSSYDESEISRFGFIIMINKNMVPLNKYHKFAAFFNTFIKFDESHDYKMNNYDSYSIRCTLSKSNGQILKKDILCQLLKCDENYEKAEQREISLFDLNKQNSLNKEPNSTIKHSTTFNCTVSHNEQFERSKIKTSHISHPINNSISEWIKSLPVESVIGPSAYLNKQENLNQKGNIEYINSIEDDPDDEDLDSDLNI